jgi:hypothetical protein
MNFAGLLGSISPRENREPSWIEVLLGIATFLTAAQWLLSGGV